jgi:hypothetical protein
MPSEDVMIGVNNMVRWGLVLSLGAALLPLGAQETGFTKEFKARFGYTPNPKDHLRAPYTGYGLNVGYGIGVGRVALELGYFYNTGDNYISAPDTSAIPAGQLPVNPAKSVEDKRNEISGFSVRASFSQALNKTWRWQAGVQLGGAFKHQYVGDTQSLPWDAASGKAAWRDFYLSVPREGGLNPTPYLGATWLATKDSSVEFNLVLHNYQAIEYHHYAGTASAYTSGTAGRYSADGASYAKDTLDKTRRLVPHAEIAYVFHF